MARVIVDVMLKPEIHDPQGEAVLSASHRLGFGNVTGVRQGKRFELEIEGAADEGVLARVDELARELLANPVSNSSRSTPESSQEIGYEGAWLAISRLVRTQHSRFPGGLPPKPPIGGRPDVRFCLVFKRESTSVPAMRRVLGDTLRRLGISEDSIADILLAEARRLSPQNLDLHVNQDNERALRFYQKHGFVTVAEDVNPRSGAPIYRMRWEA